MAGGTGGYQVALDELAAFQRQVGGLLDELDDIDKSKYGAGLGSQAFGDFDEAHALWQRHEHTREQVENLLTKIQQTHQSLLTAAGQASSAYQGSEADNQRRITGAGGSAGGAR